LLEKLITFCEKEWGELERAPFSFAMLSALCLTIGFAGGMLYYSSQIGSLQQQMSAKDGQLSRYRVALGIDPASKGALVELNNEELALKAQAIVANLRKLSSALAQKSDEIRKRANTGEISQSQEAQDQFAAMKEVSQDFDSSLASDAYNVESELRKRLSPSAISNVIRVPAFNGSDGSRVTLTDMFRGTGFDAPYFGRLADELEQMFKLLPPDGKKP
jgi:hypothetical protein